MTERVGFTRDDAISAGCPEEHVGAWIASADAAFEACMDDDGEHGACRSRAVECANAAVAKK